ncbi:hypothetical protein AMTRI_Chr02g253810 [Amborella trichopoda]
MLLFHLVLALVIILEVGASLLLMNSDAHYSDVFGVQQQEQPNYERNLLIGVSIGMTWRKGRNRWKKRNWSTPTGVKAPDVIDLRKQ